MNQNKKFGKSAARVAACILTAALATTLFTSQAFAKPGDILPPGTETVIVREQMYWSEDTTISSLNPNTNYGKDKRLEVALSNTDPLTGKSNVSMAVIGFGSSDYSYRDAEKIVSAKLTVHCDPAQVPVTLNLYKAGIHFRVENMTWTDGLQIESPYVAQKTVEKGAMEITFDVSDVMYQWIKESPQSYNNYTFAIACNTPGSAVTLYSMNETTYPGMRPSLEIEYVK